MFFHILNSHKQFCFLSRQIIILQYLEGKKCTNIICTYSYLIQYSNSNKYRIVSIIFDQEVFNLPISRMLLSCSTPSILANSWLTTVSCTPVPLVWFTKKKWQRKELQNNILYSMGLRVLWKTSWIFCRFFKQTNIQNHPSN